MDCGKANPNNVALALICGGAGCSITISQELGHAYVLQHTSDPCDVMYPSAGNCAEPEGIRFKGISCDTMLQAAGAWRGGIKPDPLAPLGLAPSGPCFIPAGRRRTARVVPERARALLAAPRGRGRRGDLCRDGAAPRYVPLVKRALRGLLDASRLRA